jgi:hypothetical protein
VMGQTSRWWEFAGCGKFSWTATRQIPWHRRKESYGMSGLKHHPGADVGKRKGVTSSYTLQTAGGLSSIRTWRTDFVIPFNGIPDVSSMQTWEDCLNMSLCHILKPHHPCTSWRREIA